MSVYNLQIKLDRDTEKVLRELAKDDNRPLSSYCRVVLMEWVKSQNIVLPKVDHKEITVVETKRKLRRPTTKSNNIHKEIPKVEVKTQTLKLEDDSPNILGNSFTMK